MIIDCRGLTADAADLEGCTETVAETVAETDDRDEKDKTIETNETGETDETDETSYIRVLKHDIYIYVYVYSILFPQKPFSGYHTSHFSLHIT